jgi:uridine phosphorylase
LEESVELKPAYPILEYDPSRSAIVEPRAISFDINLPSLAILCYFQDIIDLLVKQEKLMESGTFASDAIRLKFYRLSHQGRDILVIHPGLGSPLAAAILEVLIANGIDRVIACGSCGVLDPSHPIGTVYILNAAVRDEGTSYYYLPPGREVKPPRQALAALQALCEERQIAYMLVKSWTTDGFYRETPARREARIREGCEVVEMEAATFFAVSEFRSVQFGQFVLGDNLVVPEGWEIIRWTGRRKAREDLFWLAADAVLRL